MKKLPSMKMNPRVRRVMQGVAAVFAVMTGLGIVGAISVIALFAYFSQDLPDYHSLADYIPATMTRLYSSDGTLLEEYAAQRRIFRPLDAMPDKVVKAFLSAEDKNFYHHTGVDAMGVLRAFAENFHNIGENHSLAGGSTITQQVVKNFLLTNEKSYKRKIKEAILAFRITKTYSKDKILELYLNEIYLGHGAYGVAAAAQVYFNKDLKDLSTEEVATLAAMPKAPGSYDPFKNHDRALERRNYVINRMLEDGYINKAEADRALSEDIDLVAEADRPKETKAAYFSEEVRRRLGRTYGKDKLYKGGLYVETTLDPRLQPLADEALRKALRVYDRRHGWRGPVMRFGSLEEWKRQLDDYQKSAQSVPLYGGQKLGVALVVDSKGAQVGFIGDGMTEETMRGTIPFSEMKWAWQKATGNPRKPEDVVKVGDVLLVSPLVKAEGQYSLEQIPAVNGALMAMDPNTGRVLAMSGGYSDKGNTFNRATQALRQPGSAFKPFVYLTAMEHGFTPASIVVDEPVSLFQGPGLPMWTPKNYEGEFLGPATLRTGLEKSRNVMTVRLAQMLGINKVADTGERFGIYDTLPAGQRNYSMVLGAHETTLAKLLSAYATIDNGGYKVQPTYIERIDDSSGETIYRREKRDCKGCVSNDEGFREDTAPTLAEDRERILDPRVAYQMTHLLEGVCIRGTAAAAHKELGIPVAGKTGTTNESRDTWFIGFTPDIVVGVFVGYDKPESLGKKETGGRVALPAFIDFMKSAQEFYPSRPFEVPQGIQFAQVDKGTGTALLPWQAPAGAPIDEAFIVGGPIFLPGQPDVPAVADGGTATPTPASLTVPGATPQLGEVTNPDAVIKQTPVQAGDGYAQDYYRAYQQQRIQNYQQYMGQRPATGMQPLRERPGGYAAPQTNALPVHQAPASTGTGGLY